MFSRQKASLLLTLVSLLLLAGCGLLQPPPTPLPPPPEPTVQPDWTVVTLAGPGIRLALPPDWELLDLETKTPGPGLAAYLAEHPDLASRLQTQMENLAAANVKLFALEVSPQTKAGGFNINLNIVADNLTREITLSEYVDSSLKRLENMEDLIRPISNRWVSLRAGIAAEILFKVKRGEADTTAVTQYIFMHGKLARVATFVVPGEQIEAYYPAIIEPMIQSLEFIAPAAQATPSSADQR
jgi:hypothetical protein